MTELKEKLNLLEFQKTLNKQFLEIFENKNNNININLIESASLGLGEMVMNYRFFIQLKDLKNITGDNKCEPMPLTKDWIMGFNQIRGSIFTIIDFHRVIEYILNQEIVNKKEFTNDSNTLYVKEDADANLGIVIDSLSLEYTGEFTKLFKCNNDNNKISWCLEEEIEFDLFVKKENMSNEEWDILTMLQKISSNKLSFSQEDIIKQINESSGSIRLLWVLISDIYLDGFGKHPIFVIDIQRLTKFLMSVSPF